MVAMYKMSWDDIRVFLAVAREGSLSQAARSLAISQPTAGRRIKALESALNPRLFDRLPEGFFLTRAGADLLPVAESTEREARAFLRQSAALDTGMTGRVRISCDLSIGHVLARRIPDLQSALPHAEFSLDASQNSADLMRMEADLLIRQCLPDSANLLSKGLGTATYAVYSTAQYEADLSKGNGPIRWIAPDAGQTNYSLNRRWIEGKSKSVPHYLAGNELSAMTICESGGGRTVLPDFLGYQNPNLVRLEDTPPDLAQKHWLLMHRDMAKTPLIRAAIDAIIQIFKSAPGFR